MPEKEYECMRLDQQLCFPLYAAARKVTGYYTPYLKKTGLTYTQYIVLLVLWEKDSVPVSQIGERLYLDSGTLTPLLKKMEEKGWVKRTRSKEDERVVMISLTKEGKDLQKRCKDIPDSVGKCIRLNKEDAENLYRILYQILKEEDA